MTRHPFPHPEEAVELGAKLAVFDACSDAARLYILEWLTQHGDDIIAMARGRHVEGHYRFGNRNFMEYDDGELKAQAAQELADAIVYVSRILYRSTEVIS